MILGEPPDPVEVAEEAYVAWTNMPDQLREHLDEVSFKTGYIFALTRELI